MKRDLEMKARRPRRICLEVSEAESIATLLAFILNEMSRLLHAPGATLPLNKDGLRVYHTAVSEIARQVLLSEHGPTWFDLLITTLEEGQAMDLLRSLDRPESGFGGMSDRKDDD